MNSFAKASEDPPVAVFNSSRTPRTPFCWIAATPNATLEPSTALLSLSISLVTSFGGRAVEIKICRNDDTASAVLKPPLVKAVRIPKVSSNPTPKPFATDATCPNDADNSGIVMAPRAAAVKNLSVTSVADSPASL